MSVIEVNFAKYFTVEMEVIEYLYEGVIQYIVLKIFLCSLITAFK